MRSLLYGAHRPRRQGAGAGRAGDPRFRRRLCHHRRAARHVRAGGRQPHRPSRRRPATRSRPRVPTSSTATAKFWRPTCACRRSTASRAGSSTSTKRSSCLTADLPDLDAGELRERLSSQARLRLAQARHHAGAAARNLSPGPARHRLPEREQAHLSERRRGLAPHRPRQHRQSGHRRHREVARRPRARRAAHGGARHRPAAEPGPARRRSARAARAARRTRRRARQIQGDRRRRHRPQRAHRRDRRHGLGAGLRPEQSARGARSDAHQSADHRRLRDGIDLQGVHRRDGARLRQGHAQIVLRRAHAAALRQVRHPRFRRAEPRAHRAGNLHLLLQHRRGAHRARRRRRRAQGVPQKAGPARPPAHRTAGERRADRAEALGRAQHHHHRLRPRSLGRAAAGGDGRGRADEWRHPDSADLPQAQRGRGAGARQARHQARDQRR